MTERQSKELAPFKTVIKKNGEEKRSDLELYFSDI